LKKLSKILIIVCLIFLNPVVVNSAEILQIKNSNTILVGDQNRNLTIGLFCVDVNENDEIEATNLLKSEFPRGSKVKIKPFGFKENVLLAKVFNIKGTKEMTELLVAKNLSSEICQSKLSLRAYKIPLSRARFAPSPGIKFIIEFVCA